MADEKKDPKAPGSSEVPYHNAETEKIAKDREKPEPKVVEPKS